jgi:NADPH-dependent glutamate synthase beta subunit-like oxidoreductase
MDVIRLDVRAIHDEEFPPCRLTCPAGVDIRSFIYFVREGMIAEAVGVLREVLPLPAVTGRICPHFCETACVRKEFDEPVNIKSIERFVADHWLLQEKADVPRKIYLGKTAVVGSGPAGLACAYHLTKMGHTVTVFEAMPFVGGMLRIIPDFRLPKTVLEVQIDYIRAMGVEIKTGIKVGKDISFKDLRRNYQAVFWAIGSQQSRELKIDGIGLHGVVSGLDFLRDVSMGRGGRIKGKVIVVGGGNVAIDVALTAARLGADEVQIVCLESEQEMPAYEEEIKQGLEEGISFNASWGPKRILDDNGKASGIEVVRCKRVFDKEGRFSPLFDEQVTKTIKGNIIILALGQIMDPSSVDNDLARTKGGTIEADPITLETNIPSVFAGGNAILGTKSAIECIADGQRAAISIDRYLKGENLSAGRAMRPKKCKTAEKGIIPKMPRQIAPRLPVNERLNNFAEVIAGLGGDIARIEAQRCMTCGSKAVVKYTDDCQLCLACEQACPTKAVYVSPEKKILPIFAFG